MSFAARGEGCGGASVDLGEVYSRNVEGKPSGRTMWLGKNLRACETLAPVLQTARGVTTSAFGVDCVWMKMVRLAAAVLGTDAPVFWYSEFSAGLRRAWEAVIAEILADLCSALECDATWEVKTVSICGLRARVTARADRDSTCVFMFSVVCLSPDIEVGKIETIRYGS